MLRQASLILISGLLAGCTSNAVNTPVGTSAQLGAYAATAQYPTTEPSQDLSATAMVNTKTQTIQLVNASDKNLAQAHVWVNRSFVSRIDSLPAHSTVTLKYNAFYNQQGQDLASFHTTVNSVQLETPDGFYTLQGPVFSNQ